MPYDIETKDGIVIRGIPDGVKPDDPSIKAKVANARFKRDAEKGAKGGDLMTAGVDPTEGNNFLQNAAIGVGKAFYDVGRGAKQLVNQGLDVVAPRPPSMAQLVTGEDPSRAAADRKAYDQVKAQDTPLMNTGGGVVGNIAGNIGIALAPGAALKGAGVAANAAGGAKVATALRSAGTAAMTPTTIPGAAAAGAALGAVQPVGEEDSRTLNTAIGGAAGAGGKVVGDRVARALADKINPARLAAEQAQNSVRDASLSAGRAAGYTVPPSQANNSLVNRVIESLPGKAGVQQAASLKNQAVTDRLARKAVGLADDAPLTEQALQQVRANAGKAYEAVKSTWGRFKVDSQFSQDIAALGNDFAVAAKEFPDIVQNDAVKALQKALNRPDMSPQAAIELVKKLRFDASKNFRAFDDPAKAALAQAQRGAADAIDGLIERSLDSAGQLDKSQAYRAARVLIAKAHDVEAALNESSGHVSAKVLARILEKGKPMSGELETAARFARTFPTATQNTEKLSSVLGGTPLDWVMGGGAAAATGNPMLLATAMARPAARAMLVSKPYQAAMAGPQSYTASNSAKVAELLARKARPALPVAATVGALNLAQ